MKKIIFKVCLIIAAVTVTVVFLPPSCSEQGNNNITNSENGGSTETPEISETTEPDEPEPVKNAMRDITTMQLVYDMGLGINLGNTLDATGDWVNPKTQAAFETCWGSPIITEPMIKAYADAGFRVVRIPVTWSNLMDKNYIIHPDLLNRVQQIVDWVIGNGMYAIVNMHHESFIGDLFPKDEAEGFKKFEAIWSQVSEKFKDYGDYLMFESMNEPGFDKIWNQYDGGGNANQKRAFDLLNRINQRFVDVVRASGSNNTGRHLLISTYYTNIGHANNKLTKMPDDPAGRCAVSVHYYTPWTWVGLDKDESWGKAQWEWGKDKDFKELYKELDLMKKNYVDKGIPVIIGEYGMCSNKPKEYSDLWTLTVTSEIYKRDMCPILWDVQLTDKELAECNNAFYNRRTQTFVNKEVLAGFQEISATRDFTKFILN